MIEHDFHPVFEACLTRAWSAPLPSVAPTPAPSALALRAAVAKGQGPERSAALSAAKKGILGGSSHLVSGVITPVISGLTLLIPFITGVITHLLSGMSHQVAFQIIQIHSGHIPGDL